VEQITKRDRPRTLHPRLFHARDHRRTRSQPLQRAQTPPRDRSNVPSNLPSDPLLKIRIHRHIKPASMALITERAHTWDGTNQRNSSSPFGFKHPATRPHAHYAPAPASGSSLIKAQRPSRRCPRPLTRHPTNSAASNHHQPCSSQAHQDQESHPCSEASTLHSAKNTILFIVSMTPPLRMTNHAP